jgi:hypothetical protein
MDLKSKNKIPLLKNLIIYDQPNEVHINLSI